MAGKVDIDFKELKEKMDAYIDAHQMRHTIEREILLRHLCEMEQPIEVNALQEVAKTEHISRATVYNFLDLMVSARILHKVSRQHGQAVSSYEVTVPGKIKMEVVCRDCGRVSAFHDRALETVLRERRYNNFVPDKFSIFVYGTCKACRKLKK